MKREHGAVVAGFNPLPQYSKVLHTLYRMDLGLKMYEKK